MLNYSFAFLFPKKHCYMGRYPYPTSHLFLMEYICDILFSVVILLKFKAQIIRILIVEQLKQDNLAVPSMLQCRFPENKGYSCSFPH